MKFNLIKLTIVIWCLTLTNFSFSQPPKLYVHLVSHNEPTDTLQNPLKYTIAKNNALMMADIVNNKNVKWNLQTSDGFVIGALQDELATSTNIFKTLANAPYDDNVEIDPRSKNMGGRNVADQWYLLDSLGGHPTHTLGGFIWAVCPPATDSSIDWLQYRDTITGSIYGNKWKCSLLSGAGSLYPHCNDLHDFGIFKPDTTTNFYQHNPAKNLWCIGVGCAPVLDSLSDVQAILTLIKGQIDSIQNGIWPGNKFYVTRIMTNQREYGPLFFQKISTLIDSLILIPSNQLQWATINETFSAFEAWQISSGLDHSQWSCGQVQTGIEERLIDDHAKFSPNPFSSTFSVQFNDENEHELNLYDVYGNLIINKILRSGNEMNLDGYSNGIYILRLDRAFSYKLIKE
ncbi:MAG TPA: T9SS type A sorting domain-containing protein [Bacteroidia bacterium]|nr:T9SS type A sorting domain-containing protein [Bacteroidia bacterium]